MTASRWDHALAELAELNRLEANLARRIVELNSLVYDNIREDTHLRRSATGYVAADYVGGQEHGRSAHA